MPNVDLIKSSIRCAKRLFHLAFTTAVFAETSDHALRLSQDSEGGHTHWFHFVKKMINSELKGTDIYYTQGLTNWFSK
jgi:hypothetical protein